MFGQSFGRYGPNPDPITITALSLDLRVRVLKADQRGPQARRLLGGVSRHRVEKLIGLLPDLRGLADGVDRRMKASWR